MHLHVPTFHQCIISEYIDERLGGLSITTPCEFFICLSLSDSFGK